MARETFGENQWVEGETGVESLRKSGKTSTLLKEGILGYVHLRAYIHTLVHTQQTHTRTQTHTPSGKFLTCSLFTSKFFCVCTF